MEAEAVSSLGRVDALWDDFNVVAAEAFCRLAQTLFGEIPMGTALEELD